MSETMTASERAQELVRRLSAAAMSVVAPGGSTASLGHADAKAALLAYVARLEAVADAARETIANHYGPFADIKKALAALDRPEDGE